MKTKNSKKPVKIIVIALVIFIIGSVFILMSIYRNDESVSRRQGPETDNVSQGSINYNPPTDEEKKSGDDQKERIPGELDEKPAPTGNAEVIIVDAGQYEDNIEVRAFASNVVQDGNCTITFTQGSTSITKSVVATADAASTICKALILPRSDLPTPGKWTVNVKFVSATNTGESSSIMDVE